MTGNTEAELEHFRRQWREEVTARTKNKTGEPVQWQQRYQKQNQQQQKQRSNNPDDVSKTPTNRVAGITTDSQVAKASASPTTPVNIYKVHKQYKELTSAADTSDDNVSELRTIDEDEAAGRDTNFRGPGSKGGREFPAEKNPENAGEPRSALEHYERAVEKECLGSLGESVNLYRKAFKVCLSHLVVMLQWEKTNHGGSNETDCIVSVSWMTLYTRRTRINTFLRQLQKQYLKLSQNL